MRSHVGITFNKQSRRQAATTAGDCGGNHIYTVKKRTCAICRKSFPSMKSLSGHMRCHPDRDWRGINPPPPSSTTFSSPSSSSISDVDSPKIDDRIDYGKREIAINLTESLSGWAVTAKRGRKATAAEEDKAVKYLIMLAEGKNCGESEGEVVDFYEERGIIVDESSEIKKKKMKRKNLARFKGQLDFDLNELPPLEPHDHKYNLVIS